MQPPKVQRMPQKQRQRSKIERAKYFWRWRQQMSRWLKFRKNREKNRLGRGRNLGARGGKFRPLGSQANFLGDNTLLFKFLWMLHFRLKTKVLISGHTFLLPETREQPILLLLVLNHFFSSFFFFASPLSSVQFFLLSFVFLTTHHPQLTTFFCELGVLPASAGASLWQKSSAEGG